MRSQQSRSTHPHFFLKEKSAGGEGQNRTNIRARVVREIRMLRGDAHWAFSGSNPPVNSGESGVPEVPPRVGRR